MIFFFQNLKKLLFLVDKKPQNIVHIVILAIISGSIDLISFALILPFTAIIVSSESNLNLESKFLFSYLGISSETDNLFLILTILLIFVFSLKAVIAILSKVLIVSFAHKQLAKLQIKLISKYHEMNYLEYIKNSNSYYLRNIRDLSKNCIEALEATLKIIAETLVMLIILIYLAKLHFIALASLAALFFILAVTYNLFFKPLSIDLGIKISEAYKNLYQRINESIYGFKEIKINNKKDFFITQIKNDAESIYKSTLKNYIIVISPRYIFEVSIVAFVVFFIFISLNYLNIQKNLIPIIGIFAVASVRLMPSMTSLINDFTQLNFSKFAIDTCINDIKIKEIKTYNNKINDNFFFEKISFNNVSFKYPNSKIEIFKKLNFKIYKNDCIAIIGPSGSGKTTLIDIFLGLLQPTTGKIYINNKKSDKENTLSSLSAYLPQDCLIIEDTIKKNVSLEMDDKKINLNLINQSLKNANLIKFIHSLPNGINTKLGENSLRLSGGQKQRLAIARNFYLKKEIIVMDEATSSLDEENENRIIDSLNNLRGKKTIILITHKLRLLKNFNRIFSLNDGCLSEIKNA
jgi:ABC-type multidrug transport system fused ATPase/permease subunit